MHPNDKRWPRFAVEDDAPPLPGPGALPGPEPGLRGEEGAPEAARRFFEDQVGPLSTDQARRLALLTLRYGEAAVVRALAEVVILQMNNAVLALTRDRLLARHPLH